MGTRATIRRVALIEAGSPGLNIFSHVAMGRGTALLATVVRDAGWQVEAFVEDVSGKDEIDWDFVASADVVGFSAITCTLPRTRELIRRTRELNPAATIVAGGPEPTCAPERSLDVVDIVLRGEGEDTFPRLLRVLAGESAETLADIPGTMWRERGETRSGPPPRQLSPEELDSLPLVDWSVVHAAKRGTSAPVWRSRGCPMRCDFCEVCEIWPRYVFRGDEHSVEELMRAQETGHPVAFLIDDNAAARKDAFKGFLRRVCERGFARTLVVQMRADSVLTREGRPDRELLRLLKRAAGVTVVCVGVETSDDEGLERLEKGVDRSRMAKGLRAMKRYGLLVHGMFIALAEDSQAVIRRNGRFARRMVTSLQYLFEVPLPGTKRTREHEERDRLMFRGLPDLRLYDGMHLVVRPSEMLPERMQDLVTREYRRFYSLHRVVVAVLEALFLRYRRLTAAQREYLKRFSGRERLVWWAKLHLEYKLAPLSALYTGYRRVREFMRDPDYARYLERLQTQR